MREFPEKIWLDQTESEYGAASGGHLAWVYGLEDAARLSAVVGRISGKQCEIPGYIRADVVKSQVAGLAGALVRSRDIARNGLSLDFRESDALRAIIDNANACDELEKIEEGAAQ